MTGPLWLRETSSKGRSHAEGPRPQDGSPFRVGRDDALRGKCLADVGLTNPTPLVMTNRAPVLAPCLPPKVTGGHWVTVLPSWALAREPGQAIHRVDWSDSRQAVVAYRSA